MMTLSQILSICTARSKITKSHEKINQLISVDKIKQFEKIKKEVDSLIINIRIYWQGIRME